MLDCVSEPNLDNNSDNVQLSKKLEPAVNKCEVSYNSNFNRITAYVTSNGKIDHSVKLNDTISEGKPSVYLFIFVNPLSGDKKGEDLINLPLQHFRLRRFPQVQVEVHDILNEEDVTDGVRKIKLVEAKLKLGQVPPISDGDDEKETSDRNSGEKASQSSSSSSHSDNKKGVLSQAAQQRQIHVWSAGGDGTVMSVFELLVNYKIDLDLVYFSCIPFGTGNDFSQVLGWGRTIPDKDLLGSRLQNLEELIAERLEKSDAARLDIWQMTMTAYPSGYVREAGPKERKDGHDVAEVKGHTSDCEHSMVRKMSNYVSIGVQGFVGSGFEAHRAGNRLANKLVYAQESSKWVFWRRFPDLSHFISDFSQQDNKVLEWLTPSEKRGIGMLPSDISQMMKSPIDLVIQNIPHIWGREVDLWGEAQTGLESVRNRSGPCDPNNWKPQRANDGRLEVMSIENMTSYLKKLANIRGHVSRIGQFDSPFDINFREPEHHVKEVNKLDGKTSTWTKAKAFLKDKKRHKYEKKNMMCIMCDGEFYEMKDPKSIEFNRFAQIWTLGKSDSKSQGRLVLDELGSRNDREH
ncbi:ATP-NAD kinase-like domain-containing protein [Mycotypha africana]|uniref:ATP-NAD kinase-like domain-containing protein n=1 Tax=Mycotypha africana TaxID=64632 RepID=UPI00230193AA|nr:ATP-NAD kinase-like domain-containing protein [Mycotypha africana]KAI8991992.1 ATP-NAD kinase-like domain-containing protein [Mycotypha africana]